MGTKYFDSEGSNKYCILNLYFILFTTVVMGCCSCCGELTARVGSSAPGKWPVEVSCNVCGHSGQCGGEVSR